MTAKLQPYSLNTLAMSEVALRGLCPNCNAELHGQYCAVCGQNQKGLDRFFFAIVTEFFEEVFHTRSRAALTLIFLFFRPGFLTLEYFRGRRASYVQPLRLYLITSFICLFSLSMILNFAKEPEISAVISPENEQSGEQVSVGGLDFSFYTEEENKELEAKIKAQIEKAIAHYRDDPSAALDRILENLPPVMFFLLPVFALGMKLAYFSTGLYYTQHLVFAVHNHCFLFTAILITELLDFAGKISLPSIFEAINDILGIWIMLYIFIAMKRVYEEGYFKTLLKFIALGWYYFLLLFTGVMSTIIWGIMTL